MRLYGIEYPKVHDVGDILKFNRDRFPEWFRDEIDRIVDISHGLSLKRSPAMYGIEEEGKTPSDLFDS